MCCFVASLKIEVLDVNDNNPKFRKPYYRYTLTENSKIGVVIGNVVADDLDKNRTITYMLEGQKQIMSLLQLDKITGDLVVANKVDFETYNWLNYTVSSNFALC